MNQVEPFLDNLRILTESTLMIISAGVLCLYFIMVLDEAVHPVDSNRLLR